MEGEIHRGSDLCKIRRGKYTHTQGGSDLFAKCRVLSSLRLLMRSEGWETFCKLSPSWENTPGVLADTCQERSCESVLFFQTGGSHWEADAWQRKHEFWTQSRLILDSTSATWALVTLGRLLNVIKSQCRCLQDRRNNAILY